MNDASMEAERPVLKRCKRFRYVMTMIDRHGHTRLYFRYKGRPLIPLLGPIGSLPFMRAYKAADGIALNEQEKDIAHEVADRIEKADRIEPQIGVYLLLLDGEVVYVGSSTTMPARVVQHRVNGRPFNQVFYIQTTFREREYLERTLIRAINPSQNRAGKGRNSPAPPAGPSAQSNKKKGAGGCPAPKACCYGTARTP